MATLAVVVAIYKWFPTKGGEEWVSSLDSEVPVQFQLTTEVAKIFATSKAGAPNKVASPGNSYRNITLAQNLHFGGVRCKQPPPGPNFYLLITFDYFLGKVFMGPPSLPWTPFWNGFQIRSLLSLEILIALGR